MDIPRKDLGRRSFLALGAAGTAAALVLPATGAAAAHSVAARRVSGGLRFVVLTDTHADVDVPTNLANLRRVFAAAEAEEPAFVLNCGDITEYGHDTEFAAYRSTIPDTLFDRLRHVPGNHETRWDASALEAYERYFGASSYSFDADGIHFVALDPTQVLQEPGLYGPDDLRWLHRDLARAGAGTPSLLFQHYPVGGRNYYVNDTDALLEAIEPFSVRGIFAGHIHREENTYLNGLTQVTGLATKGRPVYYVVDRAVAPAGEDALAVTRVQLPPASTPDAPAERVQVAVIALGRRGPGQAIGPVRATAAPVAGGAAFAVDVTASTAATAAFAKVYPQGVFGGAQDGVWTPLQRRANRWTGELGAETLAAGVHRVQVRVEDAAGAGYESTPQVVKDGAGERVAAVAWDDEVGGQVQGALAERDGLVVAASTNGAVTAWRLRRGRPDRQWRTELGAVYRGPAFSADGATLFVPSADHHLYALDAADGGTRWRVDLGSPALSSPAVTAVDGEEVVVVSAGDRLVSLSASGDLRWDVEIPVMSAGRPACDGDRVYAGAGDGRAYAFDARTGARLWSFSTNTRTTAYTRLIYGPWDDVVELLPGGGVLVSTVSGAWALDGATGVQRWMRRGSYIYAPSVMVDDARLLLVDELGVAALVEAATGAQVWTTRTAPRVLNAGPVLDAARSRALVAGTGGLLVSIDLTTGLATPERQLFTANTFSTPVVVDDQLVLGAQDGVVRGVTGLGLLPAGPPPV